MIATLDDDLSAQLLLRACPPDPPFPETLLSPNVARAGVYREIWAGWRERLQNVFVPVFDTRTWQGFVFPLVVREAKPGETCVFKNFPTATEARNRVASLAGFRAPLPEPALTGVLGADAVSGDSYGLAFLLAALWKRECFVRAEGRDPGVTLVATGALGEATVGPVGHVEEKLAAARARLGERLLFVYCAEKTVLDPDHVTLALPPRCPLPEALRLIFAEWSRRVGIPASWRDLYVAANALRRNAAEVFAADKGEALVLGDLAAATDDAAIPDDAFAFVLPPFGAPRAKPFVPNGNLLERLDAWAACPPDAKKRDPFVLYGSTGSGRKTSLAECFARNSALFLGRVHHWRLDRDLLEDRTPGALAAAWDDLDADLKAYCPTCVVAELATLDGDATPVETLIADFAALCRAHGFRGVLLCDAELSDDDESWWKDDPGVAAGLMVRLAPAWPWWGRPADFFRDDGAYDEKANDRYVRALLAGAAPPHWLAACVPQLRLRPAARLLAIRDRLRAGEPLTAEDFMGEDKEMDVTTLNVEDLLFGYLTGTYSHRDLWDWLVALFHDDDDEAADLRRAQLSRTVFHPLIGGVLGSTLHLAARLVLDFILPFALWGRRYATLCQGDDASFDWDDFMSLNAFSASFPAGALLDHEARMALAPWAIACSNAHTRHNIVSANDLPHLFNAAHCLLHAPRPEDPTVAGLQGRLRLRAMLLLGCMSRKFADEADATFNPTANAETEDILDTVLALLHATRFMCLIVLARTKKSHIHRDHAQRALDQWAATLQKRPPRGGQLFLPRLRRMFRQGQSLLAAKCEATQSGATNNDA